jgi:metallo-beta-lactamase class B
MLSDIRRSLMFWSVLLVGTAVGLATITCSSCAERNRPQAPFRIFGNTYYVGPHGLSSILITSEAETS